jgi:hypothetical protein
MPLRLRVPSPSPALLILEALIIIASAPDERGADRIAYALVPFHTCVIIVRCNTGNKGL